MLPLVLVHGGGFDHRCWDRLAPHLGGPVLAVDLPGRGNHPAPLAAVNFAACADAVVADIDAAGFDRVVLVGHSLAGCSMPAIVGRLGERIGHAVFVACSVPEHGTSTVDTLPEEIRAMARAAAHEQSTGTLDPGIAEAIFGNDLDREQFAWMCEVMVPEATNLTIDPVDLSPLRRPFPRTWVRPVHDAILDADKQLRFAANAGVTDVIDLDAAHMCMISRPAALTRILTDIAASG